MRPCACDWIAACRRVRRSRARGRPRILADAGDKVRHFSVEGRRLNREHIDKMRGRSLMLVTALSPVIGYEKPAPSPTRPMTSL